MSAPPAISTLPSPDEGFQAKIAERLWSHPTDFLLAAQKVRESRKTVAPWRAAGVLVPLAFRPAPAGSGPEEAGYAFRMIKRSAFVPQPGDLSFPGGLVHPVLDRLLRMLLIRGPLPTVPPPLRPALSGQRGRGGIGGGGAGAAGRLTALFLATALRESWEEIRLPPGRVRFIGPLPTCSVLLFRRAIFPMAALVMEPVALRPNREVERIVEIPLSAFGRKDQLGCFQLLVSPGGGADPVPSPLYPCLIHREPDGTEEVLWGASFIIAVQFLRIAMDYRLPDWRSGRVVQRTLTAAYRTGRTS